MRKKKKRRKVKEKVKKLNEKRKMKECSLGEYSSFLNKENVIIDTFCLFFFVFFLKDVVKLKNKLRTIEPILRTIFFSFMVRNIIIISFYVIPYIYLYSIQNIKALHLLYSYISHSFLTLLLFINFFPTPVNLHNN